MSLSLDRIEDEDDDENEDDAAAGLRHSRGPWKSRFIVPMHVRSKKRLSMDPKVVTNDDATAFRVALIFGDVNPGWKRKARSVSTLGWYDAIPLGLADDHLAGWERFNWAAKRRPRN